MGFPSADHLLGVLTASQWKEWEEWRDLRGPLGPERWDFYVSYLAMHAGGPYPKPKEVTVDKFVMPWFDAESRAKSVKPEKKR